MKKTIRRKTAALCFCLLLILGAEGQVPPRQWARQYGGSGVDIAYALETTQDGGLIAAGYTDSKNGDISPQPSREYWDLWLLKMDACGNPQWERSFGGHGYESARDILQTADGGYLVLGETNSTDGGVVAGYGGTKDIWLLKLDASGDLQWQKRLGGTGLDIGNQIYAMTDGSYLIAATTSSNDGDLKGNHGTGGFTDGALLKVDASGNLLWSKCYGGSKNEELMALEVIQGRIYAAGYANSTDGDIPPSQKNYDVWLLALDGSGNKVFSKVYGGSQNDVSYAMSKGANGSLCLAGYTTSSDGDVSGAKGSQDYWVLNLGTTGILNWQKVLGGSSADYAGCILTDRDGGYLVGGISYSSDGDIDASRGEGDFWMVKLTAGGELAWKKNWGGSRTDYLRSMVYRPSLDEYYLGGDSESMNGDFTGGHGETDVAIIKLKQPAVRVTDTVVCQVAGFSAPADTLRDACGYDSVIRTYRPVPVVRPLSGLPAADTVFEGQSLVLPSPGSANIVWSAHPSLSCTHCPHPTATPLETTVYNLTLQADGCQVNDRFTLVVLKDALVQMPSAFTPNGDGLNDQFGPLGKVPGAYKIQIYNRYGEVIFTSSSLRQKWDGYCQGRLQPNGVFIYQVQYLDRQQQWHHAKGTVLLIR